MGRYQDVTPSGAYAGADKTELPFGTAGDSGYNENAYQLYDGVCLKCHVKGPLSTDPGVGNSF
jgi:mono/diheme cytochrome c family protein